MFELQVTKPLETPTSKWTKMAIFKTENGYFWKYLPFEQGFATIEPESMYTILRVLHEVTQPETLVCQRHTHFSNNI